MPNNRAQSNLVEWGKHHQLVRREVARALNEIPEQRIKDLLWRSMSQGLGFAEASNGTHAEGWAVDFTFKGGGWNNEVAHEVAAALMDKFAVAFRAFGEVAPRNPAHLHIAYKGRSNSAAILARQAKGHTVHKAINRIWPPRFND